LTEEILLRRRGVEDLTVVVLAQGRLSVLECDRGVDRCEVDLAGEFEE
jgi:hypothetical protein